MLLEHRIADQSLYTFDRVLEPQLNALGHRLPIWPNNIALDFDGLAFPLGFSWESVNLL